MLMVKVPAALDSTLRRRVRSARAVVVLRASTMANAEEDAKRMFLVDGYLAVVIAIGKKQK